MTSLFTGWPTSQLAQVYFRVFALHKPQYHVCHDFRMIGLAGKVRRYSVDVQHNLESAASAAIEQPGHRGRRIGMRHRITQRAWLLRSSRMMKDLWSAQPRITTTLEQQLRELKPNLVYAVLGNYPITKLTTVACERLGLPLFIHVTDDFARELYRRIPFGDRLRHLSDHWLQRAVDYSAGRGAIGPLMAEEYSRRYGKRWSWFTTLADSRAYYSPAPNGDGTVRFLFAGDLGLGRSRVLRQLAESLKQLDGIDGIRARLTIHTMPGKIEMHRAALDVPPITELAGFVPTETLRSAMGKADVLVHVDSFDRQESDRLRLSFSTKLSQYMMAGRCILAIAPETLASTQIVRQAGAGVVVGTCDPAALKAALVPLLAQRPTREQYGLAGRKWAVQWADQETGQERFRAELLRAASDSTARDDPIKAA